MVDFSGRYKDSNGIIRTLKQSGCRGVCDDTLYEYKVEGDVATIVSKIQEGVTGKFREGSAMCIIDWSNGNRYEKDAIATTWSDLGHGEDEKVEVVSDSDGSEGDTAEIVKIVNPDCFAEKTPTIERPTPKVDWKKCGEQADALWNIYASKECAFPPWSKDRLASGELEEYAQTALVYYSAGEDLEMVEKVATEREPVNIEMKRSYKVPVLKEKFGYEYGAYQLSTEDKLMPNIAIYTKTLITDGTDFAPFHVINAIGIAFDSHKQPDHRYFFKKGDTSKKVAGMPSEKWDELVQRMSVMWRYCFECANQHSLKRVYLASVGGGFFKGPLTDKQYEELKEQSLTPVLEAYPGIECHPLPRIPDWCFSEEGKQFGNDSLLVNAWDPWSMVGNGNASDNSLDGFFGRCSSLAVLCWPHTNPLLKYKAVDPLLPKHKVVDPLSLKKLEENAGKKTGTSPEATPREFHTVIHDDSQEKRVSEDGEAYTKSEFIEFFGPVEGDRLWLRAPKAIQLDGSSGPLILGPDMGCLPSRPGGYGWIRKENKSYDRGLRRMSACQTKAAIERGYTLNANGILQTVKLAHVDEMVRGTMLLRCAQFKPETRSNDTNAPSNDTNELSTEVSTVSGFSMNVAMLNAINGARVATINAASAYHAGGGFETGGRHALEESMCVQSSLFSSLQRATKLAEQDRIRPSKIAIKRWLAMHHASEMEGDDLAEEQPSMITKETSIISVSEPVAKNKTSEKMEGIEEQTSKPTTDPGATESNTSESKPEVLKSKSGDVEDTKGRAIVIGDKMVISGVTTKTELNGTPCTVEKWDAEAAKWIVVLETEKSRARLSPRNLSFPPNGVIVGPIASGLLLSPEKRRERTDRSAGRHHSGGGRHGGGKKAPRLECHIPDDGAIVSPSVEVFRGGSMEGYPFYGSPIRLDVVSLAMPNCNPKCRDSPIDRPEAEEEYMKLLRSKAVAMFAAAKILDAEVVVLPTIGCGVFMNDPQMLGTICGDVLREEFRNVFKKVLVVDTERFGAAFLSSHSEAPKATPKAALTSESESRHAVGEKKVIYIPKSPLDGQSCTITGRDAASGKWRVVLKTGKTVLLAEESMMDSDILF